MLTLVLKSDIIYWGDTMAILYNNAIVEKRNVLNELRSNNMTVQELRFFSIYLSKINPWDISTRVVRFPMSDFQRIMGFGRLNIAQLKSSTNSLLSKIVNIPTERGGYTAFQLFKECTVDKDDNGEWYVEIDAHDKALPLMFEFKNRYFTYELWNALRLKSPNQVRMYEILKQYEKLGRRELTIQELRELLGIAKNEYDRWERFRVRVLDSCQQALKETTDICYTYERGKVGKGGKWLTIIFHIQKNEDYIDQLTLDEFIEIQPKAEIIEADFVEEQPDGQLSFDNIVSQHSDQSEELDEDELRLARYGGDEWLATLAEAVNDEFCKEDMEQISIILTRIDIPKDRNLSGADATLYGRQHYLREKYAALNAEEAKKARKGEKPISDRAAYFKRMLEKEAQRED